MTGSTFARAVAMVLLLSAGTVARRTKDFVDNSINEKSQGHLLRRSQSLYATKVVFDYVFLIGKTDAYGNIKWDRKMTKGYTSEESSQHTASVDVTAKVDASVEYAFASASASLETNVGYSYSKSFKSIQTSTTTEQITMESGEEKSTWNLYQEQTTVYFGDSGKRVYKGALRAFNHEQPLHVEVPITNSGMVWVQSWRKGQMQCLIREDDDYRLGMRGYGWTPESEGFFAFSKPHGDLLPVYQWRKGESAYYVTTRWQNWNMLATWGWSREKIAFYAYPRNTKPSSAVEIKVFQGYGTAYAVRGDWPNLGQMSAWGWTFERTAEFAVAAQNF